MNPSLTQKRNASAKETLRPAGRRSLSRASPAALGCAIFSSLLAILCPFRLLLIPSEQFIKAVKDRNGLRDQLPVIFEQFGQPANHEIEPGDLRPVELVIFEVHVVDDFSYLAQSRVIAQAQLLDHGLEGAIFAPVRELSPVQVEADPAFDTLPLGDEGEAGPFIDEALDEPDRGQAINEQVAARHPKPPLVLRQIGRRVFRRDRFRQSLVAVLRGAKSLVAPFISGQGWRTARGAEEIN